MVTKVRPSLIRLATRATSQSDVKCAVCGASGQELTTSNLTQYFICKDRRTCIQRLEFLVSIYPEGVVNLTFNDIPLVRLFYLGYLYYERLQHHPEPREFEKSAISNGYMWASYYRSFGKNGN